MRVHVFVGNEQRHSLIVHSHVKADQGVKDQVYFTWKSEQAHIPNVPTMLDNAAHNKWQCIGVNPPVSCGRLPLKNTFPQTVIHLLHERHKYLEKDLQYSIIILFSRGGEG